jgi:hypothetical protein
MAQKRLLRETGIVNFVQWLNQEPSEESELTGWDRSEILPFLRSEKRIGMLEIMQMAAIEEALTSANNKSKDLKRLLMLGVGIPTLLSDLWRVRECACGCGRWFLAERQNQKHYADHRKKAWQQSTTPEQKERRRVQNREAQKRFYNKTFKARPGA